MLCWWCFLCSSRVSPFGLNLHIYWHELVHTIFLFLMSVAMSALTPAVSCGHTTRDHRPGNMKLIKKLAVPSVGESMALVGEPVTWSGSF